MQTTSAEIETIIRIVVERLRAMSAGKSATSATQPPLRVEAPRHALRIEERLVTLESLRGRLEGIQVVEVNPKAVVTPAVMDELRQQKIRLERVAASAKAMASAPNTGLLVIAKASHKSRMDIRAEHIASSENCGADAGRIAAHFNSGGQKAIWWTDLAFAAMRAAGTNKSLRPVQLGKMDDLPRAVQQADPNLLILDELAWSGSDVVQLANRWIGGSA